MVREAYMERVITLAVIPERLPELLERCLKSQSLDGLTKPEHK